MNTKEGDHLHVLNPVPRKSGEKRDFHWIGTVWDHGDKLTGELFAAPINGQLVIMKPSARGYQDPSERKEGE